MRVIPVIDLLNGVVVRGVGGRRDEYRPIQSRIAPDAQPATVARAFVERFGFDTVYVADLDAIMRGRPNVRAWKDIAAAGLKLWLDAGVGNSEVARSFLDLIVSAEIDVRFVVGLESLLSEAELAAICAVCADQPPIFSLDLKAGQPLVHNSGWRGQSPLDLAILALSAGATDVIVLDLEDVGTNSGTSTLNLCVQLRRAMKTGTLIAGGGVRTFTDLTALSNAGCDAALVASALHDGRLTPEEVRQTGMSAPR